MYIYAQTLTRVRHSICMGKVAIYDFSKKLHPKKKRENKTLATKGFNGVALTDCSVDQHHECRPRDRFRNADSDKSEIAVILV